MYLYIVTRCGDGGADVVTSLRAQRLAGQAGVVAQALARLARRQRRGQRGDDGGGLGMGEERKRSYYVNVQFIVS